MCDKIYITDEAKIKILFELAEKIKQKPLQTFNFPNNISFENYDSDSVLTEQDKNNKD